ncbi:MAG: ABC-ATPase domain-containing protein, partial [Myxococcota bacterium]
MAPPIERVLSQIDGRQYPRYKQLLGRWDLDGFIFFVDHVQGDPYAAPSRVRVRVPSGVGSDISEDRDKRTAAEDWYLRKFVSNLQSSRRGSGRSGEMSVLRPGPEVVERSAVWIF